MVLRCRSTAPTSLAGPLSGFECFVSRMRQHTKPVPMTAPTDSPFRATVTPATLLGASARPPLRGWACVVRHAERADCRRGWLPDSGVSICCSPLHDAADDDLAESTAVWPLCCVPFHSWKPPETGRRMLADSHARRIELEVVQSVTATPLSVVSLCSADGIKARLRLRCSVLAHGHHFRACVSTLRHFCGTQWPLCSMSPPSPAPPARGSLR